MALTEQNDLQFELFDWARGLSAQRRFGEKDRRGTSQLIDAAAAQRAADNVRTGASFGLGRELVGGHSVRGDGLVSFGMERFYTENGAIGVGSDHIELDCHGAVYTHIDALNHVGLDGTWYSGWGFDDDSAPSIAEFAPSGLFTRGVLADLPALRGTEWVSEDEPVTADELDRAITGSGTTFESGDALLLYMGRDRYESSGEVYEPFGPEAPSSTPGIGREGAQWIADHGVSILAWDFQDAHHPTQPPVSVHMLIWAIGLIIVDSCDFGIAVPAMRAAGRSTAAFSVAPLFIRAATGCNVNPLLVL